MMYEKPLVEVITIMIEDVITSSGLSDKDDNITGGEGSTDTGDLW